MTQHKIKRRVRDFHQSFLFNKQHERGCDVEVIFNEQRIPLHSVVLGGNSRYFEIHLFSTPMVPKAITLENVNTEAIKAIIQYSYSGKMNLHQNDTINILKAAHFLTVQTVIDGCCKMLKSILDSKNCFEIWGLAQKFRLNSLANSAFDHIQTDFIGITEDFLTIDSLQLTKVLQSDIFKCAREKYLTIVKGWINYDPEVRNENLLNLLKDVHLEQLPSEILELHSKQMCLDKSCVDFFVDTVYKQKNMDVSEFKRNNDSTLIVLGGCYSQICRIVETYDTHSNIWKQREVEFGGNHFSCAFYDQKLFVIGGSYLNTMDSYDIKTWQKTSLARMHLLRKNISTVVVGEYIYAIGGYLGGPLPFVERYNVKANQWRQLSSMPTAREDHNAAVVDGEIFVVGGNANFNPLAVNECYTISTGKWRSCKPLLEKRFSPGVAACHGFVYAAGGLNEFENLSSVERYDTKVDQWAFVESLSTPRHGAILVNFCESLIISGGYFSTKPINTVEKYDPLTKRWSPMASLSTARQYHNMVVVPQHLLS